MGIGLKLRCMYTALQIMTKTSEYNMTTLSPHPQQHASGRLFHFNLNNTSYNQRLKKAKRNITPTNQNSAFADLAVDGPTVPGRERGEGPQGSAVIKNLVGTASGELVKVGVYRPRRANA